MFVIKTLLKMQRFHAPSAGNLMGFFYQMMKQVNYDIQQYSLKVSGERKTF